MGGGLSKNGGRRGSKGMADDATVKAYESSYVCVTSHFEDPQEVEFSIKHDVVSHIGCNSTNKVNQDTYRIFTDLYPGLFFACILDGHGKHGEILSNAIGDILIEAAKAQLRDISDSDYAWENAFKNIFQYADSAVEGHPDVGFKGRLSGCTASIVCISNGYVRSANVGDSRIIAATVDHEGKPKSMIELSKDHRLDDDSERRLVQENGGLVKRLNEDSPERLYLSPEQKTSLNIPQSEELPGIMLSRTLGDIVAKHAGCSAEPSFFFHKLDTDEETVIVMGSDGIWDMVSNEEAVSIVAKDNLEKLVQTALSRWEESSGSDNITGLCVTLEPKS